MKMIPVVAIFSLNHIRGGKLKAKLNLVLSLWTLIRIIQSLFVFWSFYLQCVDYSGDADRKHRRRERVYDIVISVPNHQDTLYILGNMQNIGHYTVSHTYINKYIINRPV